MSIASSLNRDQKLYWGRCESLYEATTLLKRPGLVTQLNLGEYKKATITVLFEEPDQLESLSTVTKGVRAWLAPSFFKGLPVKEIERLCNEVLQYFAEIHYIHISRLATVRAPQLLQLPNLNRESFVDGLSWNLTSREFHDVITHSSVDRWDEVLKRTTVYSLLLDTIKYMLPRITSAYTRGRLLSFRSVPESLQLEEIERLSEDENFLIDSIRAIALDTQYPKVMKALTELNNIRVNNALAGRADSLPEDIQWHLACVDNVATRTRVASSPQCTRDMLLWFLSDEDNDVRRTAATNIGMTDDISFVKMLVALPDPIVVEAVVKSHLSSKKKRSGIEEIQQILLSNWRYVPKAAKEHLVQRSHTIPEIVSKLVEEDDDWIAKQIASHRRVSGKILIRLWNKWATRIKEPRCLVVLSSIASNYKCPSSLRKAIFLTIKKDPEYYSRVAKSLASNTRCREEELCWIYTNCNGCAGYIAQNKGAPMSLRRRCGYE